MRRWRGHDRWGEFVPAFHYKFAGTSLCGVKRSLDRTKYTTNRAEVTCKNCLKKLAKGGYVEDHFNEDLFVL